MKETARKLVRPMAFLIFGTLLLPWIIDGIRVYVSIPVFPVTLFFCSFGTTLFSVYILILLSPFMYAGALLLDCRTVLDEKKKANA